MPGGLVHVGEELEVPGPPADLLRELAVGGRLGGLAGLVAQAGRDLQQLLVDRPRYWRTMITVRPSSSSGTAAT